MSSLRKLLFWDSRVLRAWTTMIRLQIPKSCGGGGRVSRPVSLHVLANAVSLLAVGAALLSKLLRMISSRSDFTGRGLPSSPLSYPILMFASFRKNTFPFLADLTSHASLNPTQTLSLLSAQKCFRSQTGTSRCRLERVAIRSSFADMVGGFAAVTRSGPCRCVYSSLTGERALPSCLMTLAR